MEAVTNPNSLDGRQNRFVQSGKILGEAGNPQGE